MPRPRSAGNYEDGVTAASRAGLAEVMITLGAYRDALVLIGGWAPYLILEQLGAPGREFVHVGSIDIDLAVNPGLVDAERYATIVELLLDRGYEPGADPLFQVQKTIRSPRDGQDYLIRVDFLPPAMEDTTELREAGHRVSDRTVLRRPRPGFSLGRMPRWRGSRSGFPGGAAGGGGS